MKSKWPRVDTPTISCCWRCQDRLVTEHYNCHDHCERYMAEAALNDQIREKRKQERETYRDIRKRLYNDGHGRRY